MSEFGSEIPITVLGIVMKISQILNSFIIGIAAGAQPIIGFNYGAKKFDRVKQTLKYVLITSLSVSTIAFILFQTIPDKLILLFGNEGDLYKNFACLAFRIYLMLVIVNGIQIPSGIFFQAIGKSVKSAFISLSRQILFLVPSMVILGNMFGVLGVLHAGPVADGLAFLVSGILLIFEIRNLNKSQVKENNLSVDSDEKIAADKKVDNVVITISREYGSGGRYVGKLVAEKLGIKLYDEQILTKIADKTGLSLEYIENHEQKRSNLELLNNIYYSSLNNSDEIFIEEEKVIKDIASKGSCVIIGRCADFILKDMKNTFNVFIYSTEENKIKRAVERFNINEKDAKKQISKINKLRSNHYKHYTSNEWGNKENYDLCINSDSFGVEKAADVICQMVKNI